MLSWAQALGEFGAANLFAGSLQGCTCTVTLAIDSALESDLAPALLAVMVVTFTLLFVVRGLAGRRTAD